MKNLLVINGSPNKKGHTVELVDEIIRGVNGDIGVNYINCYDMNIGPCMDCKYCSRIQGSCSISDDMIEVYKKIRDSHVILLASPMYFGMFPAPLKSLIDRCQVFWSEKNIFNSISNKRKRGIFLFHGGSTWSNMFLPMETVGRYFFNTINCDINYKVLISNTDNNSNYLLENKESISRCQIIINQN